MLYTQFCREVLDLHLTVIRVRKTVLLCEGTEVFFLTLPVLKLSTLMNTKIK